MGGTVASAACSDVGGTAASAAGSDVGGTVASAGCSVVGGAPASAVRGSVGELNVFGAFSVGMMVLPSFFMSGRTTSAGGAW